MAQDLSLRRTEIAQAAVAGATALLDAYNGLATQALIRAQSGNFVDSDLTADGLQQLTTFMVGLLFDTLVPEITTFLNGHVNNDVGQPLRRDLLIQFRR